MGHYNSFLVRVWTDENMKIVRGYIQHTGTEEAIHFLEWEKMVDFILNHLSWKINSMSEENPRSLTCGSEEGGVS